jgi:hypothetical protein
LTKRQCRIFILQADRIIDGYERLDRDAEGDIDGPELEQGEVCEVTQNPGGGLGLAVVAVVQDGQGPDGKVQGEEREAGGGSRVC